MLNSGLGEGWEPLPTRCPPDAVTHRSRGWPGPRADSWGLGSRGEVTPKPDGELVFPCREHSLASSQAPRHVITVHPLPAMGTRLALQDTHRSKMGPRAPAGASVASREATLPAGQASALLPQQSQHGARFSKH